MARGNTGEGSRLIRLRVAQALVISAALAALAVPPVVLATSGTATLSAPGSALRLLAMLAFTLIFMQIMTGSLRRPFSRLFPPLRVHRVHIATGITGFALALTHGILVISFGFISGRSGAWIIGPVALVLLVVTITTAVERRHLARAWRRIHQVNYVIFAAAFVHAMFLGTDLLGNALAVKVVFSVYMVTAAIGTAYRLWERGSGPAKRRKRMQR